MHILLILETSIRQYPNVLQLLVLLTSEGCPIGSYTKMNTEDPAHSTAQHMHSAMASTMFRRCNTYAVR